MKIQFLYFEDCPSHDKALARLREVMAEVGSQSEIEIVKVETDEEAEAWRFTGSPTILIDGQDIDPPPVGAQSALTCRVYVLPNGRYSPLPAAETIREALLAAAR
ncbi:MAG: DUF2703 domain-containing protein [Caldilineales bacterium]|nr:DUF2703 domain-containing protein [Caldilineales bacterium]